MSDNDIRPYFLCTFPRKVIRILEYLRTYIESEMHIEWRDQNFLCVVHVLYEQMARKFVWVEAQIYPC